MTSKHGKSGNGNWMVVLTLASGGQISEIYPTRELAEAARNRAITLRGYVAEALVHYCD